MNSKQHPVLHFLKNWTLPLAILLGIATYPLISYLTPLTPILIFVMLLLTFCKLTPKDIHIHLPHLWLLLIQLLGCLAVYGVVKLYHPVVAQGALICVLVPTAISATVITGMLGGNVPFLTSYLLLCNVGVALVAPVIFPLVGAQAELSFLPAFTYICKRILPLLLLPLALAWMIRYLCPQLNRKITGIRHLSFYLWAVALTIVTGSTVKFLIEQENPDYQIETGLALVSLIICVGQFLLGRKIGKHYGDPISCGQGLGQKNMILAIWMAQTYMNPVSSVAPAAYVLWQNIINSWQLWRKRRQTSNN
jgi:BASS family bile acid:Na+ symporter